MLIQNNDYVYEIKVIENYCHLKIARQATHVPQRDSFVYTNDLNTSCYIRAIRYLYFCDCDVKIIEK